MSIGELGARVVGFLAAIYTARRLGASAYGTVGVSAAIALYFVAFTEWGMDLLGSREVAQDRSRVRTVAPQVWLARLALSTLMTAVLAAVAFLLMPPLESRVLAVYALTVLSNAASTRWVYLGLERTRLVAVTRGLSELIKGGLILLLLRGPDSILWVPLAQFIGEAVAAAILLFPIRRLGFSPGTLPRRDVVVPVFTRAVPLMLTHVLGMVVYNSDVILLRFLRDDTQAGLYLAAYTLIGYLGILGTVGRSSLVPTLTRLHPTPDRQRLLYDRFMMRAFALGLPIAACGSLLAQKIIDLAFGAEFAASGPVLVLLLWSVPLLLMRSVMQALLIAVGRQDRVLRMTGWTALFTLMLNLALIPRWGMMAAAGMTVAGESVRLTLAHRYVRAEGVGFTARNLLLPCVATAIAVTVLILLDPPVLVGIALGGGVYASAFGIGEIRSRRADTSG